MRDEFFNRRDFLKMTGCGAISIAIYGCKNVAKKGGEPRKQKEIEPELLPIEDDPNLPRVLLIGDSISMGYTIPTRNLLRDKANVHRIPENGGPTIKGLEKIDEWLGTKKWDVIYFNWGLHDLKYTPQGGQLVPVEQYEQNLRKLVKRLKATGAYLIWASSTPVPAGAFTGKFPRKKGDEVIYNAAAKRVMDENGIAIDDLYGFAMPQIEKLQKPDNVHFIKPQGYDALAEKVAANILEALKQAGKLK